MFEIIYFSPHYMLDTHKEIISLLNKIKLIYGINWYEKVVTKYPTFSYKDVDLSEKDAYDMYLKPAFRQIRKCLETLSKKGVNVYVESVSRKFRSRSGNYYVAGSLVILSNGRVFCALKGEDEILTFLKKLLKEGPGFLIELVTSEASTASTPYTELSEASITREYGKKLISEGYSIFLNVKHNLLAKHEELMYLFSPDADIIAVKNDEVIGIEVKGERATQSTLGLEQIYVGLGETLLYLINPVIFEYNNKPYNGGIFDKVYLLIPKLPSCCKNSLIRLIRDLKFIGLVTLSNGIVIEPAQNPYLNPEKKYLFLANIKTLARYMY